jgi:Flp pilus assembly protein CpaB
MVPRRSLAVVVAVALALIASAAAYAGLHTAQEDAAKNATLTSIYVLKGVVPRDDTAAFANAEGLIKTKRIPRQLVPVGAVTRLSAIGDYVAQYDLPPGEVVTNTMFVSPATVHGLAAQRLPKGDVAVSVTTDLTHGVAGLIEPGDKADVLVNMNGDQETFLLQSVLVLAVDTTLVPARGQRLSSTHSGAFTQARNVVTFAVPPPTASKLAEANNGDGGVSGGIYLALDAIGNIPSSSTITGSTLVPGQSGPAGTGTGQSSEGDVSKSDTNENHP